MKEILLMINLMEKAHCIAVEVLKRNMLEGLKMEYFPGRELFII